MKEMENGSEYLSIYREKLQRELDAMGYGLSNYRLGEETGRSGGQRRLYLLAGVLAFLLMGLVASQVSV